MSETKNCVRCFKPAKFWTGHVLSGKDKNGRLKYIIAGWCSKRCYSHGGFSGHYIKKMGILKE